MQIGDNVRVCATGRRARIIEDHGQHSFRVLFYSEPVADALNVGTIGDEDDAGGIYDAEDREIIP